MQTRKTDKLGWRGVVRRSLRMGLGALACVGLQASAQPVPPANDVIVRARAAWAKKDAAQLQALREEVVSGRHPLAVWVDYWELNNRLGTATQEELDGFYLRWPESYLEDRLRNDWLLELGRRRDFTNFRKEKPRFKLNDDREVNCWAVLARHQEGEAGLRTEARAAWLAQRDQDDGCQAMAATLYEAKQVTLSDVWLKARQATEGGRQRLARHAAGLVGDDASSAVADVFQNPLRYLAKKARTGNRTETELSALALIRLAQIDPEMAASQMQDTWAKRLPKTAQAGCGRPLPSRRPPSCCRPPTPTSRTPTRPPAARSMAMPGPMTRWSGRPVRPCVPMRARDAGSS